MTHPAASEPHTDKLQKVLAANGVASRREVERWIVAGRVLVNGQVAHVGQRVASDDDVRVDGRRVSLANHARVRVLAVNKIAGVVCTRSDPERRRTVFDDLPNISHGRWVSVGRLDIQTTGLLLLTNSGALANRMMHPSTGLDREYAVRVTGMLEPEQMTALAQGVDIDGEMLKFSDIRYFNGTGNNHWYHVVLMEGKNREVRRLFEAAGVAVSRLKRVRYGPVILPSWLRRGANAEMRYDDIATLHKLLRLRFTDKTPRREPNSMAKTSLLLPYPTLAHLQPVRR